MCITSPEEKRNVLFFFHDLIIITIRKRLLNAFCKRNSILKHEVLISKSWYFGTSKQKANKKQFNGYHDDYLVSTDLNFD